MGFSGESQRQTERYMLLLYMAPPHCGVLAVNSRIVLMDHPQPI